MTDTALPLRILFITDRFPPQAGGVGASAARLTGRLAARGHVVHVLHLGAGVEPGAVQSARDGAVMVHRLGALDSDDLTWPLAERVIDHLQARLRFDVFHGHYLTPAGYLAALCARLHGVRACVSVRGNDIDRGIYSAAQLPFLLWTLHHAEAVGCVSTELAAKCRALSGRDDIRYTPNGVDTNLFHPGPKDVAVLAELGIGEEALLGFVGELRFKKGTHFLLDAFRAVREQRPAVLLLIGSMRGEDKALLRGYLRQYPELEPDIRVIDYLHDPAVLCRYYQLLDLVLAPSLWDGMPNSVLEAMACGRCVLAGATGGIRDLIRHGETGLLIQMHELHRLGEGCLEALAAGGEFRMAIGCRARRYVEEHHSPEAEVERLLALYAASPASNPA